MLLYTPVTYRLCVSRLPVRNSTSTIRCSTPNWRARRSTRAGHRAVRLGDYHRYPAPGSDRHRGSARSMRRVSPAGRCAAWRREIAGLRLAKHGSPADVFQRGFSTLIRKSSIASCLLVWKNARSTITSSASFIKRSDHRRHGQRLHQVRSENCAAASAAGCAGSSWWIETAACAPLHGSIIERF